MVRARQYGFDPAVLNFVQELGKGLPDRDKHRLHMIFLPLDRKQIQRLFPMILDILMGEKGEYTPENETSIPAAA